MHAILAADIGNVAANSSPVLALLGLIARLGFRRMQAQEDRLVKLAERSAGLEAQLVALDHNGSAPIRAALAVLENRVAPGLDRVEQKITNGEGAPHDP